MLQEKILLLGFGDIASRLADRLAVKNYQITGVRRSRCEHASIAMHQADCRDANAMDDLLQQQFDVIVMTMTPGEYSDAGYQQAYVASTEVLMESLSRQSYQPRLVVFVSSTSVYAQREGEWIDEQSETKPTGYSGKRLLEAESLFNGSSYQTCIVRFSGIYGPGRKRLIEQVIAGQGVSEQPILYSNRIHVEDCAGVLAHLIDMGREQLLEPLYLASDSEPASLYEVKQWMAQTLGLPRDHLKASTVNRSLRSSKRCSNQRLLDTGYRFSYPDYRTGYADILNGFVTKRD